MIQHDTIHSLTMMRTVLLTVGIGSTRVQLTLIYCVKYYNKADGVD